MEDLTIATMNRWGALGAAATLLTWAAVLVLEGHVGGAFVTACGAVCTATLMAPAVWRWIRPTMCRRDWIEDLALLTWPTLVLVAQAAVAIGGRGNVLVAASVGLVTFLYVGVCAGAGHYSLHRAAWLLPIGLAGPAVSGGVATADDVIPLLAVTAAWSAAAQVPARLAQTLEHRGRRIRQLAQLADADPLTGLWNRRALTRDLQAVGDPKLRCRRPDAAGSIAILDLDDFKLFNDAHGHLAGDRLLADFAVFLAATVRRTDLLYRFGGEEFVLLLPGTPLAAATTQVEQLSDAWQRHDGRVTFSAGVAPITSDQGCLETADTNLYIAKRAGRDLVIAEPAQPASAQHAHDDTRARHLGGPGVSDRAAAQGDP